MYMQILINVNKALSCKIFLMFENMFTQQISRNNWTEEMFQRLSRLSIWVFPCWSFRLEVLYHFDAVRIHCGWCEFQFPLNVFEECCFKCKFKWRYPSSSISTRRTTVNCSKFLKIFEHSWHLGKFGIKNCSRSFAKPWFSAFSVLTVSFRFSLTLQSCSDSLGFMQVSTSSKNSLWDADSNANTNIDDDF